MVPSRRSALRAAVGLALASVAGCLGAERTDSAAKTTDDSTTAPAATADSTDTPTATRAETTTRQYLTSFPPDERLALRAFDPVTVSVEMYESESRETRLAAETYALDGGETVRVTEFEPKGRVAVTVERPPTAGTAVGTATAEPGWEGYVGTASRYELAVAPDGVEVASYAEA